MELFEFKSLDDDQQIKSAHRGTFLADKIESGNKISLYNVDNFFVEVYFSLGLNKVVLIRAFDSIDHLDRFLDSLDIEGFEG